MRPSSAVCGIARRAMIAAATVTVLLSTQVFASAQAADATKPAGTTQPATYQALYNQAVVDYQAGRLADANLELATAEKSAPDIAQIHELLGMIALRRSQVDGAIAELEKASRLAPTDIGDRKNLAQAYLTGGRIDDFVSLYRSVLVREPKDPDALGGIALALAQAGRNADAATAFQSLVAVKPTASAYVDLGIVEQKSGQAAAAAESFRQAATLDPTDAEAWLDSGLLDAEIGADDRAVAALSRAIDLNTDKKYEAHLALAQVSADLHQNEKALSEYTVASRLKPAEPDPLFNIAVLDEQAGHKEDAIAAYRKVLALQPTDKNLVGSTENNLGLLLASAGDSREAIPLLTASIDANPAQPEARAALGDLYGEAGNTDEAVSEWKAAIVLDPRDDHSRLALAASYMSQKQYAPAAAQYDVVALHDPDDAGVQDRRGEAYEALKDYETAMAAFRAALALDPNDSRAENNIGATYQDEGKTDLAITAYKKALVMNPNLDEAKKNLANLTGK